MEGCSTTDCGTWNSNIFDDDCSLCKRTKRTERTKGEGRRKKVLYCGMICISASSDDSIIGENSWFLTIITNLHHNHGRQSDAEKNNSTQMNATAAEAAVK